MTLGNVYPCCILGIWRTRKAPAADFKQDILITVSKKGDIFLCYSIALLSIPGKIYANVLSPRMAEFLEISCLSNNMASDHQKLH